MSRGSDRGPGGDLTALVGAFLESYREDPRAQFINKRFIPSRDEIIEVLKLLFELFYPGYFGRQDLTDENVGYHVGATLHTLREKLAAQIELCLCYGTESGEHATPDVPRCRATGAVRRRPDDPGAPPRDARRLVLDAQAAFDGDPAARASTRSSSRTRACSR